MERLLLGREGLIADLEDINWQTPLLAAARNRHTEVVELLLN